MSFGFALLNNKTKGEKMFYRFDADAAMWEILDSRGRVVCSVWTEEEAQDYIRQAKGEK